MINEQEVLANYKKALANIGRVHRQSLIGKHDEVTLMLNTAKFSGEMLAYGTVLGLSGEDMEHALKSEFAKIE